LHTRTPPHLAHAHAPASCHPRMYVYDQFITVGPMKKLCPHLAHAHAPASCASRILRIPHLAHAHAPHLAHAHAHSAGRGSQDFGKPACSAQAAQAPAAPRRRESCTRQGSAAGSLGFTSPGPQRQMCCCRCCRRGATTGRKATSLTRFERVFCRSVLMCVCVCVVRG